jgi:phosphatidylglycerophosphate synthase
MTATDKVTVADVRASFNSEIKAHPSIAYFGRPLANLITPYFHNRGWTANQMTIARTYIAFAGVALLLFPVPLLWPIAAAIFFLTVILDCVDGNLARLQNDASYLGKFLDGVADGVYPQATPFFLGIGTWLYYDDPRLIILGALITIIGISNQMIRNRLSFFREWMTGLSGELTAEELANAQRPRDFQASLALIVVNGYFVAIFGLLIPYWGAWIFFGLGVVTQLLPEFLWLVATLYEAAALLKRGRISRHARVTPIDE